MKTFAINKPLGVRSGIGAFAFLFSWLAAPPATMAEVPPVLGELEYFFNQDPGEGEGNVVPFTGHEVSFTALADGLPLGTHTLYLRVRAPEGDWGPPRPVTFNIEPSSSFERVAALEASVGAPAIPGSGQPLPVEGDPGTWATVSGRVDLPNAGLGTETLYLRARDDAGTWGPAFPFTVGMEISGDGEIPAAVQYAWLYPDQEPVWQTRAFDSVEGRDGTVAWDPGVAGLGLGTHYLALRGIDSADGLGPVSVVPVSVVPDSLTGHGAVPERLIAYVRDEEGMIEGTGLEFPLGSSLPPVSSYSFELPIETVDPGPVEVVAYLRMVSGETSPLAVSAPVLVVVAGTNGYAVWRADENRFTEEEQADASISGPLADPDGDGVPNQLEMAFGGDPWSPDRGILPVIEQEGGLPVLRFRQLDGGSGHRAYNYTADGVRYTVQYAFDPSGEWLEGGGEAFEILSVEGNGDGTSSVRVSPAPAAAQGRQTLFLRLKVTLL